MQENNTGWIIGVVVLAVIIIGGIAWASTRQQTDTDTSGTNTGTGFIPEEQPNSSGTGSTGATASTSINASTTLP